jgi:hypothetical protein
MQPVLILSILYAAVCGMGGLFAIRWARRSMGEMQYRPGRWLVTGEAGVLAGTASAGAFGGAVVGLLQPPERSVFIVVLAIALAIWGCLISFGCIGCAGLLHCYGKDEEKDWGNCFLTWKRSSLCVMLFEFPLLLLAAVGRLVLAV